MLDCLKFRFGHNLCQQADGTAEIQVQHGRGENSACAVYLTCDVTGTLNIFILHMNASWKDG